MNEKGTWHGVDRKGLNWSPSIDYSKCTRCGLCILTCGNDVFGWNMAESLPVVTNPGKCVLGCTTCGKICPEDAITFPDDPKVFIRNVVTKYKVFLTVKKELEERLNKFPDHAVHTPDGLNKVGMK